METPQNELHPEPAHGPEHEKEQIGRLEPQAGSLLSEEISAEVDASEEHEAAPETEEIRGDKLREAVFAKNANPEPEA